jgi:hypothetical protein
MTALETAMIEAAEARNGQRVLPLSGHLGPRPSRLLHVLAHGRPGDELTDAQLADIVGLACGPGGKGYSAERSAILHCRRAHDVWWARARQTGVLRCLGPAQRVDYAGGQVRTAGRRVRVAVRAASVEVDSPATLAKRDAVLAQAGAMAVIASAKTVKKLTCAGPKAPPEIAELQALVAHLNK